MSIDSTERLQRQLLASNAIADALIDIITGNTEPGELSRRLSHAGFAMIEHAVGAAAMPAKLREFAAALDEHLANVPSIN